MAVKYWDGSADTNWMTAANWTAAVVPVDGDVVIFDRRQVTKPTTGMTDAESGDEAKAQLGLLHFKKGYTGGCGTALLPCCMAATKIIIEGTGDYHLCCAEEDQSHNATIATVIINSKDANVYLYSNCNDDLNLCEFTAVYVLAGTVYLAYYTEDTDNTGCYVKDLYIMPKDGKSSNVTVTMEKDAYDDLNNVATNVYMTTGTLISDSPIGTMHLQGNGTVYYGSEESTGAANQVDVGAGREQLNITTLRQSGGTFNWLPDVNSGTPTITTAWVLYGTFNAGDTTSDDIAKTITTLHSAEGAIIDIENEKSNITITNWYDLGATIRSDYVKRAVGSSQYDQP